MRSFLEHVQALIEWLDSDPAPSLSPHPKTQEDITDGLLALQDFQRELEKKEGLMDSVRNCAQDLIGNRDRVPGLRDVKKQWKDLGKLLTYLLSMYLNQISL